MAERIIQDPHLELMPDHAGPHYAALRAALTQNGMLEEQAVQALNNSWSLNHNERIQLWNQQVINDAAAAEEAQRAQREIEEQQAAELQQEKERERAEAEKKKPKMKDFNDTAVIGSYIAPRPAQYALKRLEEFDFVELWYFTPEGCADASLNQLTQNDDAFGLTKSDNTITLKSVSSIKASKNVIPDADLSFRQMSMAKNALLPLMLKYQWSEKAINAFAHFFTQLELHPFRQREYGEQALLVYQARARREWHDQMKLGNGFNIGILNDTLIQSCYREILDQAQLKSLSEASCPATPYPHPKLTPSFLALPLSLPTLASRFMLHALNAPCSAPVMQCPPPATLFFCMLQHI